MTGASENEAVAESDTAEIIETDESKTTKEESSEALFFDAGEDEGLSEDALVPCATLSADHTTLTFSMRQNDEVGAHDDGSYVWDVSDTSVGEDTTYGLYPAKWGKNTSIPPKVTKVIFEGGFSSARPKSCVSWFRDMTNLKRIDGINNLNTSDVEDMTYMFNGCSSLTELDVSRFDTSNVKTMWGMFAGCSSLTKLDVSHFKTDKVIDMTSLFGSCSSLKSIDVRSFNTKNVTSMRSMFYGCSGLKSIDVSSFNTSKNTDFYNMFYNCSGLTTIDVTGFDTSSGIRFDAMFMECSGITELDISNFDTSKAFSIASMFDGCSKLTELDLSGFNVGSIKGICPVPRKFPAAASTPTLASGFDSVFMGCSSLKMIYCDDTWLCKDVNWKNEKMFEGCTSLVGAIKYDSKKISEEYANPDTGYFTHSSKKEKKDEKPDDSDPNKESEQVNAFVERMYQNVLKRASDAPGKKDWSDKLLTGKKSGAGLAQGFICSDEFTKQGVNDEEFVNTLYSTFFDRKPDEGGKSDWLKKLSEGTTRNQVLAGFVNSAEFGNLCDKFGIARGTMLDDGSEVYNEGVRNFVLRNYTQTLGRNGETAGVEDWSYRINKGELTMKDVAISFLHSQEFLNKNLNNTEYVKVLYRTFLGREADDAGLKDWVGQLDSGKGRDDIVSGFSDSQEFANIMAEYQ